MDAKELWSTITTGNEHFIHEVSFHDVIVGVFGALRARIIGPMFYVDAIN
jgi:hypothetical protein